jgi:PAP2 superfamily
MTERRHLLINWSLMAGLALTLVVAVVISGFSIRPGKISLFLFLLVMFFGSTSYVALSYGTPRWPNMLHAVAAMAQVILVRLLITPLTYIAASANYPLQDERLDAADKLLGLNWLAYLHFVNDHQQLGRVLMVAYFMVALPIGPVILLLSFSGYAHRSYQILQINILAIAAATVISIFVPAIAAYTYLGLTPADFPNLQLDSAFIYISDFTHVRDGTLRELDPGSLTGIIQFPSFHAAACIIYIWGIWPVRWIRAFAVTVFGLMLLSTPIFGGHYFIDAIAGVLLACLCIWISQNIAVTTTLRRVSSLFIRALKAFQKVPIQR